MKIYLIGSLRNPKVPILAEELRAQGHSVFDDWFAAGPEADDYWQRYERGRGHDFKTALEGLAVGHIFNFDREHLFKSDIGILMLPAGKSGHLELGIFVGQEKKTYIILDGEPERFDIMYKFVTKVCFDKDELFAELKL